MQIPPLDDGRDHPPSGDQRFEHAYGVAEPTDGRPQIDDATALLAAGRIGRWRWPWAVLGTVLTIFAVIGLAVVSGVVEETVSGVTGDVPVEVDLIPGRLDTYAGFVIFALALVLAPLPAVYLVHRQSARHLLGRSGRFDWRQFWRASTALALVAVLGHVWTLATEPASVSYDSGALQRLPWIALALPVIFVQSFAEDFLFKGYLLRTWGAACLRPFVVAAVIAALFTAGHADNDDIATDRTFYLLTFLVGELILMAIYLRAGNLGAATGLHWMNNVWSMCLVATLPGQSSALAIATVMDTEIAAGRSHIDDPWAYASFVAMYGLLWLLLTSERSPLRLQPDRG